METHRVLIAAALIAFTPGARATAQADVLTLQWPDTVSATSLFRSAIAANRFEFLAVCGYACGSPRVGWTQYRHCYSHVASIRTMDPTGDVIESNRHLQLKNRAWALADTVNQWVLRRLDSLSMRECPAGEDWDELFLAMNRLADSLPHDPFQSSAVALDPATDREAFQFHTPNPVHQTSGLRTRLCQLPHSFGIHRTVRIALTSGDVNDNPKRHGDVVCVAGRVAGYES
jgi:hypothetical protein